jgi:hypothetical protein
LVTFLKSYSQKDSVWVILTFTSQIEDGKKSSRETVTNQKTYTLNWKILRELKLDSITGRVYAYKVYFYDDRDRLSSVEEYSIEDSLICGMKYSYDKQNRISGIRYYASESSQVPVHVKREVYKYYSDTLKKSVMAYDTKGKKIYSITYGYDQQKMENSVKRKYRVAPEDGIIQSDERKLLDDQGAIVEMLRTIRLKNGKLLNVKSVFEYNDQHLLTSVKKYIENGLETETIYKYFANNRLMITEVHDRNEMLLSHKHFDYRIYYINLGSNKSLLE